MLESEAPSPFLALWPALWVQSTAQLRILAEKLARESFKARSSPLDASLWYILARQPGKLAALFKASRDEKIASFLGRDFEGDETARVSARKNGFSLVSKQQLLAAAAFFLLGQAVTEAVNLIALNMREPHLALLVVRLAARSPDEKAVNLIALNMREPHLALLVVRLAARSPDEE
ncbi:RAVE protein 1 C terminal-domain-containing protein, partial [Baffinella frigidus]